MKTKKPKLSDIQLQDYKKYANKTLTKALQAELKQMGYKITKKTTYRNIYNRLRREERVASVREAWTDFQQGIISYGEMQQALKRKQPTFKAYYKEVISKKLKPTTKDYIRKPSKRQLEIQAFRQSLGEKITTLGYKASSVAKKMSFIKNWKETAINRFPTLKKKIREVEKHLLTLSPDKISALIYSQYAEIKVIYASEGDTQMFEKLLDAIINKSYEKNMAFQQAEENIKYAKSKIKNLSDVRNLAEILFNEKIR